MWASVIKAVVGGIITAALDAWRSYRRDKAIEEKGGADAENKGHEAAAEARRDVLRIRDRLRTDPEFARRVREHFDSASSE